jgi:repressor LexA
MNFGDRLKKIRKQKNITQLQLSELIGISRASIAQYENNIYQPSLENIESIANTLNIDVSELFEDKANKKMVSRYIPLIGKSSCGKPKDYDLNGYEPIPVPLDMYKDGMYAVEAEGDSMKPKINDGDVVYCQPNRIIDSGNIVHYWLNGESGIKKYKINEAGTIISLIPINSDYEVITIHCDEKHELIMGRVVGKIDRDF